MTNTDMSEDGPQLSHTKYQELAKRKSEHGEHGPGRAAVEQVTRAALIATLPSVLATNVRELADSKGVIGKLAPWLGMGLQISAGLSVMIAPDKPAAIPAALAAATCGVIAGRMGEEIAKRKQRAHQEQWAMHDAQRVAAGEIKPEQATPQPGGLESEPFLVRKGAQLMGEISSWVGPTQLFGKQLKDSAAAVRLLISSQAELLAGTAAAVQLAQGDVKGALYAVGAFTIAKSASLYLENKGDIQGKLAKLAKGIKEGFKKGPTGTQRLDRSNGGHDTPVVLRDEVADKREAQRIMAEIDAKNNTPEPTLKPAVDPFAPEVVSEAQATAKQILEQIDEKYAKEARRQQRVDSVKELWQKAKDWVRSKTQTPTVSPSEIPRSSPEIPLAQPLEGETSLGIGSGSTTVAPARVERFNLPSAEQTTNDANRDPRRTQPFPIQPEPGAVLDPARAVMRNEPTARPITEPLDRKAQATPSGVTQEEFDTWLNQREFGDAERAAAEKIHKLSGSIPTQAGINRELENGYVDQNPNPTTDPLRQVLTPEAISGVKHMEPNDFESFLKDNSDKITGIDVAYLRNIYKVSGGVLYTDIMRIKK
jgi:hypothetical protein